jgi:hypothetical protein
MTTKDLEKLAAGTPCSDQRKAALLWAAGEIRALREALEMRIKWNTCQECGECIDSGMEHSETCRHYATEQAVRNE